MTGTCRFFILNSLFVIRHSPGLFRAHVFSRKWVARSSAARNDRSLPVGGMGKRSLPVGNLEIADCGLAIADYQPESLFNPKSAIRSPQSDGPSGRSGSYVPLLSVPPMGPPFRFHVDVGADDPTYDYDPRFAEFPAHGRVHSRADRLRFP